jgi:hypothetical protein
MIFFFIICYSSLTHLFLSISKTLFYPYHFNCLEPPLPYYLFGKFVLLFQSKYNLLREILPILQMCPDYTCYVFIDFIISNYTAILEIICLMSYLPQLPYSHIISALLVTISRASVLTFSLTSGAASSDSKCNNSFRKFYLSHRFSHSQSKLIN